MGWDAVVLPLLQATPSVNESSGNGWGSRSDIVMVAASLVALGISIWSFVRQSHQADRQDWWQREQAKKQEKWQQNEAERQEAWRAEEVARLERWREEERQRLEDERKPKVRVKTTIGFSVSPLTHSRITMLYVTAVNTGQIPVQIGKQAGFIVPGEKVRFGDTEIPGEAMIGFPFGGDATLSGSDVPFPFELRSGRKCQTYIAARKVTEAMRKQRWTGRKELVGYFEDEAGNQYRADPFSFDVDRDHDA